MAFLSALRASAPRTRGSAVAVASLAAVAALALSACGTGQKWVDEGLSPSGNGAYVTLGPVQAQNLTLVEGPAGSQSLALVGNLINTGDSEDALVAATLPAKSTGGQGVISGGSIPIPPAGLTNTSIGYNSDHSVSFNGVDAPVSGYVPVTLSFKNAGQTTVSLLVVPPVGYYDGITPAATSTP